MEIKLKIKDFEAGAKLRLADMPTDIPKLYDSDSRYETLLRQFQEELRERQDLLYAQARWAVLVIFQGMDTSGKDGAISHVMSGVNPQGCSVWSFKTPTDEELSHDFLWRAEIRMPRRGSIGIFNRSYYEDALVPRVHRDVFERQRLPVELRDKGEKFWKRRLKDIARFESIHHHNGMQIVKFFLHLSKEEQRKRLIERLTEPAKHWKVSESDFRERAFWKDYQQAYQDCLRRTSGKHSPWYVVPADDKKNARLIISHILVETMREMPLRYPELMDDQKKLIRRMKEELKISDK